MNKWGSKWVKNIRPQRDSWCQGKSEREWCSSALILCKRSHDLANTKSSTMANERFNKTNQPYILASEKVKWFNDPTPQQSPSRELSLTCPWVCPATQSPLDFRCGNHWDPLLPGPGGRPAQPFSLVSLACWAFTVGPITLQLPPLCSKKHPIIPHSDPPTLWSTEFDD